MRWENFFDAMSKTRLQDDYNNAIQSSDIFVALFFTKSGKFTEEEFGIAYQHFQQDHGPLIWTYFKDAEITTASARKEDLTSLWAFQERLKQLGHFHTVYKNIEDLKLQFRDQLDRYWSKRAM